MPLKERKWKLIWNFIGSALPLNTAMWVQKCKLQKSFKGCIVKTCTLSCSDSHFVIKYFKRKNQTPKSEKWTQILIWFWLNFSVRFKNIWALPITEIDSDSCCILDSFEISSKCIRKDFVQTLRFVQSHFGSMKKKMVMVMVYSNVINQINDYHSQVLTIII